MGVTASWRTWFHLTPRWVPRVSASGSERAGEDEHADHQERERGEHVAPPLEPLPLDLVAATGGGDRQTDDRADRDGGEDCDRADRSNDSGCRGGEEDRQDCEVG